MDTITTEEPSVLTTFLVSVMFVSISILLLRTLSRFIDKSAAATNPAQKDSSPWDLGSVLLLFGFFLLGQAAILTLAMSPTTDPDSVETLELNQPTAFVGLSLLNLVLSILAVQLFRLKRAQQLQPGSEEKPSFWLESGGNVFNAIRLGILGLLCWIPGHIGLAGLWSLALSALEIEIEVQDSVQLMVDSLQQSNWALIIPLCFYGAVMAPAAEEILFRGVLFRWLRGHWGFIAALVVSSIVFALVHDSVASWLPIAALGGVSSWLYHRSGQLLTSVVLHSAFNSSMFLLMSLYPEEI